MAENQFSFTGVKLRTLPLPRNGRLYFSDADVRGMGLRVTTTGAKSFVIYKKFNGKPVRVTLGEFDPELPETRDLPAGAEPIDLLGNHPSLNVRMARKLAVAVMAQLHTGVNPAKVVHSRRKGMTLGELFLRYKTHLIAEGKKTTAGIVWMWERYLGDLPGAERKPHGAERTKAPGAVNWQRQKLSEITHQQVSKLRLDLGAKVGRTTANRVIELLSAMFNFAKQPAQRFFIGENPAEGIGKFDAVERERYLRSDEAPKFFEALNEEQDQDFADYVRLSIYTGARRGNVLRMQWSEISLSGAVWTLSGEQLKNGEPLTIPLVQQAVDVLQKRAAKAKGKAWVFPGDTAEGHMGPQRKKWLEFVKRAGAPDLRVHDLRRSLGSWMANSGASTVVTMRALGHKTVDAALIYQRLAADPVREAAQRAVTALMDAAKSKPGQVVKMPTRKHKARG